MKKTLYCLVFGTLISFNPVIAAEEEASAAAKLKLNPWTDCGFGAMIFAGESDAWGAGAAISNIIWDLGTTAVTSNLSSQETCTRAKYRTAMFIKDNFQELEQQTAQGYGDHIDSMLDIYECNAVVRPTIVASIRNNMASNISDVNYSGLSLDEKSYAYYTSVDAIISTAADACLAI